MKAFWLSVIMTMAVSFTQVAEGDNAPQYTLTVEKTGAGFGTVTSNPRGLRCGTNCTEFFKPGQKVALKAKADPGSYFAGWSGACAGAKNCVLVMFADASVSADFERKEADMELSEDTLDFGAVEIGDRVSQILKISNKGTGNLKVALSGLKGTEFRIIGNAKATIAPNKAHNFKITLKVTEASQQEVPGITTNAKKGPKIIDIKSNDPKRPSVKVPLTYNLLTKTEQYNLLLKTEASIKHMGCVVNYTETGTIPFALEPYPTGPEDAAIRCQGNPDPKICYGTSRYTITSKACPQGTNITGEGTLSWTLSGTTIEKSAYLSAKLSLTGRKGSTTICTRGGCVKYDGFEFGLAALVIVNTGSTLNPLIPIPHPSCLRNPLTTNGVTGFIEWCI